MASATGSVVLVDAAGKLTITGNAFSYTSGSLLAVANAAVDLTVSANLMTSGSGAGFLLSFPRALPQPLPDQGLLPYFTRSPVSRTRAPQIHFQAVTFCNPLKFR